MRLRLVHVPKAVGAHSKIQTVKHRRHTHNPNRQPHFDARGEMFPADRVDDSLRSVGENTELRRP